MSTFASIQTALRRLTFPVGSETYRICASLLDPLSIIVEMLVNGLDTHGANPDYVFSIAALGAIHHLPVTNLHSLSRGKLKSLRHDIEETVLKGVRGDSNIEWAKLSTEEAKDWLASPTVRCRASPDEEDIRQLNNLMALCRTKNPQDLISCVSQQA